MTGGGSKRVFRKSVCMAMLAPLVVSAAAGCSGQDDEGGGAKRASAPGAANQARYEELVRKVLPTVVQIQAADSLGSGVVFDDKGAIVTNAHVVGDAKKFEVVLPSGGEPLDATLVGSFPAADLAVVRVTDPSAVRPAAFGDSGKLRVGQPVLAMGNPLGYSGSVTEGIVSGLGRTISHPGEDGGPAKTIVNAVQTSAPINPGNSGGALVDMAGQIIGIPTMGAVDPTVGASANGLGFAIPSNTAKDFAQQIIESGRVTRTRRATLGIRGQSVVAPDGRPAGMGVALLERGSPAAEAGIQEGDIITAINGTPTPTTVAMADALAEFKPGDEASVSVTRPGGAKGTVSVRLGELPGD